eukprot:CAMPEP_0172811898 /NCGR_PEP_ID=MMETSP1075-20121228/9700_1 /TAXON_ID=2916 /ORGANISM="Ceratium fusus, Strain PA161109" /LENGTH=94 /DNA_ID=CAMNT_0013651375 /DNA_START=784 /DNA_END=1069 /DNA_ORIENTATION=-
MARGYRAATSPGVWTTATTARKEQPGTEALRPYCRGWISTRAAFMGKPPIAAAVAAALDWPGRLLWLPPTSWGRWYGDLMTDRKPPPSYACLSE